MKRKAYVTISVPGEHSNIGVIDLGVIDKSSTKTEAVENSIKENGMETKLVEALRSHFDCPVKVIFPHFKRLNPILIEVDVIIEDMEEDRQEKVTLDETWLY